MICLGAILMLYACMFRISVKDERITVRALLKKPYSFTFREIESVTRDIESRGGQVESLTIRTSTGKKLKVESIFISYPSFSHESSKRWTAHVYQTRALKTSI